MRNERVDYKSLIIVAFNVRGCSTNMSMRNEISKYKMFFGVIVRCVCTKLDKVEGKGLLMFGEVIGSMPEIE